MNNQPGYRPNFITGLKSRMNQLASFFTEELEKELAKPNAAVEEYKRECQSLQFRVKNLEQKIEDQEQTIKTQNILISQIKDSLTKISKSSAAKPAKRRARKKVTNTAATSPFKNLSAGQQTLDFAGKSLFGTKRSADQSAAAGSDDHDVKYIKTEPGTSVRNGSEPTASTSTESASMIPGALMNQQGLSRERHVIWSGFLEWQEKLKEGQKVPRQAPCQVTSQVVNGEPEVKGDGWPSKLIMQLIPKGIVGNLGGQYFKDVKTVIFMLQHCLESENLTKVMETGFAGCVHFMGNMPNCSIKILVLLYAKDKNAFLGFIPNDQLGFVDRMRLVIRQQKNANMNQRGLPAGVQNQLQGVAGLAGPGMPQAQGNIQVEGNQMQHAQPGQPLAMQGAGLQAGNVGQIQGLQGQNMSGAVGMQQQPAMAAGAQQGNIQMIAGGMNQMPGMAGQQASGADKSQPEAARAKRTCWTWGEKFDAVEAIQKQVDKKFDEAAAIACTSTLAEFQGIGEKILRSWWEDREKIRRFVEENPQARNKKPFRKPTTAANDAATADPSGFDAAGDSMIADIELVEIASQ